MSLWARVVDKFPWSKYPCESSDPPIILESAYRHGVQDEDILHALRYPAWHFTQSDSMVMFIGPSRIGDLMEVGVVQWYGDIAVAHALSPARPRYLR